MGEFKKSGGFGRGGNPRTKRAEQSSHDGSNQGRGFNRQGGYSDRPRFSGGNGGFPRSGGNAGGNPRVRRAEQSSYDGRDGSRPQMFSAVCSECSRACEVPFRPTGDRPVFCNDCFGNKRGSPQGQYQRRDISPAHNFPRKDFTPSPSSFSKPPVEDKRIDELKQQLDAVNKKLDTIIEMMKSPAVEVVKAVPTKKTKVKKLATATREPGERSSRRITAKK